MDLPAVSARLCRCQAEADQLDEWLRRNLLAPRAKRDAAYRDQAHLTCLMHALKWMERELIEAGC